MEAQQSGKDERRLKTSVHICPQCGFSVHLKKFGLGIGTSGLVTCPKCDSSGPVFIGTAEKAPED
jgi:ssDNA-binding Zn-finger/Zn-ribbon topoisomerase 1